MRNLKKFLALALAVMMTLSLMVTANAAIDTSAAVTGIAENDYVITTSSKPLAPGTQVRMVENP